MLKTHSNLIGERLRIEMKKRGITSAELAKRSDVKMSFLYDVISGKSANPSTVKLAKVAEVLCVNLNYLVGNTNNPARDDIYPFRPAADDDYVSIARISVDVSAGAGSVVSQEHPAESYHFRRAWICNHLGASQEQLRMLYVRGDSMEPTLCNDDLLLIDTEKKLPTPPGIFVLYDGFGLVAKRLELIKDGTQKSLRIVSDNPQYQTYERGMDDVSIIGRVVWFAREI